MKTYVAESSLFGVQPKKQFLGAVQH